MNMSIITCLEPSMLLPALTMVGEGCCPWPGGEPPPEDGLIVVQDVHTAQGGTDPTTWNGGRKFSPGQDYCALILSQ